MNKQILSAIKEDNLSMLTNLISDQEKTIIDGQSLLTISIKLNANTIFIYSLTLNNIILSSQIHPLLLAILFNRNQYIKPIIQKLNEYSLGLLPEPFFAAIIQKDYNLVQLFIEADFQYAEITFFSLTPICQAIQVFEKDIFDLLFKNTFIKSYLEEALQTAISLNNIYVTTQIIQKCSNINDETVLTYAIKNHKHLFYQILSFQIQYTDYIQLSFESQNLSAFKFFTKSYTFDLLINLAKLGWNDAITHTLQNTPKFPQNTDKHGKTPLFYAVKSGSLPATQSLLHYTNQCTTAQAITQSLPYENIFRLLYKSEQNHLLNSFSCVLRILKYDSQLSKFIASDCTAHKSHVGTLLSSRMLSSSSLDEFSELVFLRNDLQDIFGFSGVLGANLRVLSAFSEVFQDERSDVFGRNWERYKELGVVVGQLWRSGSVE